MYYGALYNMISAYFYHILFAYESQFSTKH